MLDLSKTFKNEFLKMCAERRNLEEIVETWWWNEEVKSNTAKKKAVFNELCRFPSDENAIQCNHKKLNYESCF